MNKLFAIVLYGVALWLAQAPIYVWFVLGVPSTAPILQGANVLYGVLLLVGVYTAAIAYAYWAYCTWRGIAIS
jgi:uncharacterized membrane protein